MMGEPALLISDRSVQSRATGFPDAPVRAGSRVRPARIVVIGEFNSGKTSLVNSLLGAAVLPTSFTKHTAYPTVVGFAAKPSLRAEVADRKRVPVAWHCIDGAPAQHIHRLHVGMPLDRLRTLQAVDTPGLGLADNSREARTLRACRGADTIIWCTPAVQAWKASELRAWLGLSRTLRRRGVLAVTFMDQIRSKGDAARLLARLAAEAGPHFRKIVPISAAGIVALSDGDVG
jgi:GTPase Era involved in 16S rRNA processing